MTNARNISDMKENQVAQAMVNFNGLSSSSPFTEDNGGIRSSINVTSVTDNKAGDYTINFTNTFANSNYTWAGTAGDGYINRSVANAPSPFAVRSMIVNANNFRFACCFASSSSTANGGYLDRECITIIFFGELS